MTTIADEARNFKSLVIPVGCHPYQEQEMIRSFYAGCSSMLKLVFELSDMEDEEMSKHGIEALQDEMDAFAAKVERGEA